MNIDFIRWLVSYAEGFRLEGGTVLFRPTKWDILRKTELVEPWEHYPILLQRAIEGLDRGIIIYKVRPCKWNWSYQNMKSADYVKLETPDAAKENILNFIYNEDLKHE